VATSKVINTITDTGFNTPAQVAAHPSGKKVYVTNKGGNSVSVIDTATNTVTKTIPAGQAPTGISVAPVKL
jgi:YVTN family beta-propeller protein